MVSIRLCVLTSLMVCCGWSASAAAAKIACVGDSITAGYGLNDAGKQSYPAQLQALLGSAHTVGNFGVSSVTLMKAGDRPYWNEANYTSSGTFDPDVVVVMLGTNDAKPQNWSKKANFPVDYAALIEHYRSLGAFVYVAAPPPVFGQGAFSISPGVVANEMVPLVRSIAQDAGTPLIDVYGALSGKAELFPDTVHPNAAGATLIAQTVRAKLEETNFGASSGSGGASGQGGSAGATGGAVTGGTSATGGIAMGGTSATGGAAMGGTSAMGGVTLVGGSISGGASAAGMGGALGNGGTSNSSGGVSAAEGGAGGSAASTGGVVNTSGGAATAAPTKATDEGCTLSSAPARANDGVVHWFALAAGLLLLRRRTGT